MRTAPGSFSSLRAHLTCRVQRASSKARHILRSKTRADLPGARAPSPRSETRRNVAQSGAWHSSPPPGARDVRAGQGSPRSSGWGRSDVSRPRAARLLLLGSSQAGKQTALTRFALRWVSSHADSFSAPAAGRPAMAPTDKERVLPLPRIPAENVKHTSPPIIASRGPQWEL